MEILFAPLFSGSSGNAIYVAGGGARVLVDAGVSGTRVLKELAALDVDIKDIDGILVTHEHDDHIKGIGIIARRHGIPIYATRGTWQGMENKVGEIEPDLKMEIQPHADFYIKDLNILAFSTPHDAADPVGYSFAAGGASFSIATDIGCIRENWLSHVSGSQAVLLESNYDREMLFSGSYPYQLKRRIDSQKGHLSNDDSAKAAAELVRRGAGQIILGHLSKQNNFPELALENCVSYLKRQGITPGRDVEITVANRDKNTGMFRIEADFL